jgi:hypothetical protein
MCRSRAIVGRRAGRRRRSSDRRRGHGSTTGSIFPLELDWDRNPLELNWECERRPSGIFTATAWRRDVHSHLDGT